jgi:catechol 2,3-dioxygenase-like lactoylglutathione lyase family enzyme
VEVLASRVLLRPSDFERSATFYRDTLGLAVFREFTGGIVFFTGGGYLELSGTEGPVASDKLSLWLQVRDLTTEFDRLSARGVEVVEPPVLKFWGLHEARLRDPDGLLLVLVEVPETHPLRRDTRS